MSRKFSIFIFSDCKNVLFVLSGDSGDWKSAGSRMNSLNGGEILRRRSWAALEDLSTQGELDRKIGKQRR